MKKELVTVMEVTTSSLKSGPGDVNASRSGEQEQSPPYLCEEKTPLYLIDFDKDKDDRHLNNIPGLHCYLLQSFIT